jgi:hypothetical protein
MEASSSSKKFTKIFIESISVELAPLNVFKATIVYSQILKPVLASLFKSILLNLIF